jgi:hypothetical protein
MFSSLCLFRLVTFGLDKLIRAFTFKFGVHGASGQCNCLFSSAGWARWRRKVLVRYFAYSNNIVTMVRFYSRFGRQRIIIATIIIVVVIL